MLFQNEPIVRTKSRTYIQHRPATLIDRPSTFYDRVIAQEFRKHFVFDYPNNMADNDSADDKQEKTNNTQLTKKICFRRKNTN